MRCRCCFEDKSRVPSADGNPSGRLIIGHGFLLTLLKASRKFLAMLGSSKTPQFTTAHLQNHPVKHQEQSQNDPKTVFLLLPTALSPYPPPLLRDVWRPAPEAPSPFSGLGTPGADGAALGTAPAHRTLGSGLVRCRNRPGADVGDHRCPETTCEGLQTAWPGGSSYIETSPKNITTQSSLSCKASWSQLPLNMGRFVRRISSALGELVCSH